MAARSGERRLAGAEVSQNQLAYYGVIRNGKPIGIWLLSYTEALRAARRYLDKHPDDEIEVIPLSLGIGVRVLPSSDRYAQ